MPLDTTWDENEEGWTRLPIDNTNWTLGTVASLTCGDPWETNQHFYFYYSPGVNDYAISLVSPIFNLAGYSAADLRFNFLFREYYNESTPAETFAAECYTGVSWVEIWQVSETSYDSGCHTENHSIPLDAACLDREEAQIRFTASGGNSDNIWSWHVDDIRVH